MASIGYATLTVAPSIRGLQAGLERQLGGVLPATGRRAGQQLGQGINAGARRGLGRLPALSAVSTAAASAASTMRSTFQRAAAGAGADVGGIGTSFRQMAGVATAALGAIGLARFAGQIRDVASGMQRTEAVADGLYRTAGHGASEATRLTGLLNREFGRSQIAMTAFQQGAQDLAWLGLNAKEAAGLMGLLESAIVATGGGEDDIGRVTSALATMQNQGKATLNEINMISQSGIPIFDLMTDHLGVTNEEFGRMVTNGEILVDDVLAGIEAQGGTWAEGLIDGAENVNRTWDGAWQSIKNTVVNGLAQQVVPLLDEMAPHMVALGDEIADAFEELPGHVEAFGERLSDAGLIDALVNIRDTAMDLAEGAAPALSGAFDGVLDSVTFLKDELGPANDTLSDFAEWMKDNEDPIRDFGENVGFLAAGFLILRGAVRLASRMLLRSPWSWAILGVSAVGAALDNLSDDHDVFSGTVSDSWAATAGSVRFWTSVITGDWSGALTEMKTLWSWWTDLIDELHVDFWDRIEGKYGISFDDFTQAISDFGDGFVGEFQNTVDGVLDTLKMFDREGKRLWDEGPLVYGWNLAIRMKNALVGNSVIPDMVRDILGWFGILNVRGNLSWDGIKSGIVQRATDLKDDATAALVGLKDNAIDAFAKARDGIDSKWSGLRNVAAKPVEFVVNTVYDDWIRGVWGKVVGAFGGDALPSYTVKFDSGGIFPGYTPGRDVHAAPMAAFSGGESVMRPEVTRAWGPQTTHALNAAARAGGVGAVRRALGVEPEAAYSLGGIITGMSGSAGRAARALWSASSSDVWDEGLLDLLLDPAGMLRKIFDQVIDWTGMPHAGTGWAEQLQRIPPEIIKKLVAQAEQMLSFDTDGDWTITGGSVGARLGGAMRFARAQHGKPYVWGGVGPGGYDCSGFTSAITNVLLGRAPYSRRHTTHGFRGAGFDGFRSGVRSPWMVGVTHAGVGHMSGSLLGIPVEAAGSTGVRVGGGARGASHSMYTWRGGFLGALGGARPGKARGEGALMDDGGWLHPGLTLVDNRTRGVERVRTAEQEARVQRILDAIERGALGTVVQVQPPPTTVGELVDGVTYALRRHRRGGRYTGVGG